MTCDVRMANLSYFVIESDKVYTLSSPPPFPIPFFLKITLDKCLYYVIVGVEKGEV
jgi:hypothetical protein